MANSSSPPQSGRGPATSRLQRPAEMDRSIDGYWSYLRLLADSKIDSRTRSKVGASDLVQETMLAAHQDWQQFRGRTEPELREWLARILTCNLLDAQKAQRRHCRDVQREVAIAERPHDLGLIDPNLTPGRQASKREEHATLLTALAKLPPHYRDVVLLRGVEGLSFTKIAERTEKTAEAVRHIWVRAVKLLARELAGND